MKRFTVTLEEDEFGDLILPIPDEVIEDLGWAVGDELEYSVDDSELSFTLKKVES
jgi:bifunctional DNA-binding transcriptional regulator/antitoxin component of YhaV-PrlF toxin-antitoxin module